MLKTRIIPCLDIDNGRVVKGVNFVDLKDAGDPVEQAQLYNEAGADELALLDISATKEKRATLYEVVEKTAEKTSIPFTVGGGIKSISDIEKLLVLGADKVSINSAAIHNPDLINEAANIFGNQCIVIAIDAKKVQDHWEIFTHGGSKSTGINAQEWAMEMESRGAGEILLTSMDRDGTREGFDTKLCSEISNNVHIPVIASGGVGTLQHLIDGVKEGGASAVLAASIFHFGHFTIEQVKEAMDNAGIPVRRI